MVDFSQVDAASSDAAKIDAYNALVEANASAAGTAQLKEVISHALRENGARQLVESPGVASGALRAVYNSLKTGALTPAAQKDVGAEAVRQLFARRGDDEGLQAVDSMIRKQLAALHKADEEYFETADMLADLSTDEMSEGDRAEHLVHVAELYLEVDETTKAEIFIKTASSACPGLRSTPSEGEGAAASDLSEHVRVRYKVTYARILDSKRKFPEAATRYFELSCSDGEWSQEDLDHLLACAINCAVLSPATPRRQRLMGAIASDVRAAGMQHFQLLLAMLREQIVPVSVSAALKEDLESSSPHMLAMQASGQTYLDEALTEHNLRAAGHVFTRAPLSSLKTLFGVEESVIEAAAARMIEEGRLAACLDQVDAALVFDQSHPAYSKPYSTDAYAVDERGAAEAYMRAAREAAAEAEASAAVEGMAIESKVGAGGSGEGEGEGKEGKEEDSKKAAASSSAASAPAAGAGGGMGSGTNAPRGKERDCIDVRVAQGDDAVEKFCVSLAECAKAVEKIVAESGGAKAAGFDPALVRRQAREEVAMLMGEGLSGEGAEGKK